MAKQPSDKITDLMAGVLRNPHLWAVAVIMVLLVIIHYQEAFVSIPLLEQLSSFLSFGLTRHTLERILFLIPVAYASVALGLGGGISILVLVATAMLPHAVFISTSVREALFEAGGVLFTSMLLVWLLYALQKGKQRMSELEAAQNRLNEHIRRLSTLHAISRIVNESLELGQILHAAVERVGQAMNIQATWLYLRDGEKGQFKLAACSGLPSNMLAETIQPGQGPDGEAAESLNPVTIATMSANQALRSTPLTREGLKNILVVPLTSKGRSLGTLGVGTHQEQAFHPDEVDMLMAIGDQLSMAIENARLYERECSVAEALRVSEKSYRDLFENASDAIWVHDLNGKILAVNGALSRLTGYEREALIGAGVSTFLPEHGLDKMDREFHDRVLRGENVPIYEQELVKKDGGIVIVQIGTSLTTREGEPFAFQHVARDITEQKRVQDNLRLYVQKVSEAQEAERKRIARELHDETAQQLVVVSRHLDDFAHNKSKLSIGDIREEVRKALEGVRHFSQELRPSILDDLGLIPAIKWLASDVTKNYNITVDTEIAGTQRQLPPQAELMLFRITQETLNNMRRHAQATRAGIRLEFADHTIKLTVSDNGKGFELPARVGDLARSGKLGLAGMQERAELLGGTLSIDSQPGKGTKITVEVPL